MQKSLERISERTKLILKSVLPLVIILALFLIAGKFGIEKIIDIRKQIDKSQKDKTVLSQKLALLESITQTVTEDSGAALSALPSKNPSLIVISQLKNLGSASGMIISGTKSALPIDDAGGVSHITISFEMIGDRQQIIAFLKTINNIAPITLLDKVRISESAGITRADVSVRSYWAPLPKNLPTLTTPITDLTPAEKTILQNATSLTQPDFVEIPASDDGGKADPFSGQ